MSMQNLSTQDDYKIVWVWCIWQTVWHFGALYSLILVFTLAVSLKTIIWAWLMGWLALHATLGGGHRLWTHRSYKAKLPLRIIYAFFQTMAMVFDIYDWALDHRIHHKYADTYADPYTTKRGFFNSHIGWLFTTKHQDYLDKVKTMDMSDLKRDPVVMFQRSLFWPLAILIGVFFPALVPIYFWHENIINSFLVATILRQVLGMHMIFLINSVAHKYGSRPYDKNIKPTDNVIISVLSIGEGWHNYHHTFPWDYKAGEFGHYLTNTTTAVIDLMAKIGWAYDLKTVSQEMIRKRVLRTGQESNDNTVVEETLWGWGDKDMKSRDGADVLFKKE